MTNAPPSRGETAWAEGIGMFAGVLLLTMGLLQAFEGLSAVLEDDVFVRTPNYVYDLDLSAWGWIHLVMGVVAVVVGACIVASQPWAYVAGIVLAILSALTNFAFLPFFPLWALLVILFDLVIIWALSTLMITRGEV